MSELHNKAEAFVLCALAEDTSGNQQENQDVSMFLLSLILAHKNGQLDAAHTKRSDGRSLRVKTERVVV